MPYIDVAAETEEFALEVGQAVPSVVTQKFMVLDPDNPFSVSRVYVRVRGFSANEITNGKRLMVTGQAHYTNLRHVGLQILDEEVKQALMAQFANDPRMPTDEDDVLVDIMLAFGPI